MDDLRTAVSEWVALDDDEWTRLIAIFRPESVDAGDVLALPGDRRHEIIFVSSGLLRFFYRDDDGKETNKAFVAEGEFAGALAASALDLPLLYGIEAIEPTRYLAADAVAFTDLYDAGPRFDRLGRRLTERLLTRKELRARSLLQQNATQRYLDFCAEQPGVVDRIPLYHVASYLGISDVHLSRIRASLTAADGS